MDVVEVEVTLWVGVLLAITLRPMRAVTFALQQHADGLVHEARPRTGEDRLHCLS
jgi:hypothetical protein